MNRVSWYVMAVLTGVMFIGTLAQARCPEGAISRPHRTPALVSQLTPYLQAEVNEVALLTAQSNCLQQQGDPLAAAVVSSYIPDHQMMVCSLTSFIQQRTGRTLSLQPNMTPVLGKNADIFAYDMNQHQAAADAYQRLAQNARDAQLQQLAMLGQSGALRHFHSLRIAQAAVAPTADSNMNSVQSALILENTAISDLQAQATQLNGIGDAQGANLLLSFVPIHQQQAARLCALLTQLGGDSQTAAALPVVPLPTRDMIVAHASTFDTQLVNTYAIQVANLPTGPVQQAMLAGQQGALFALANLEQLPVA